MQSPVGVLSLAVTKDGLCKVSFEEDGGFFKWLATSFVGTEIVEDSDRLKPCVKQIEEYFDGKRTRFDIDIDLVADGFRRDTLVALSRIPFGSTISYKELATKAGSPRAARAAGSACASNPLPIVIPCHRVIASNGSLAGFGGGLSVKKFLLRHEGAML
jgi:methylated-DNA-[protein]-cysteine S-methyltransferase